ncbi:MAG: iron-containing alcohol dehydrogenase [Candidatus Bathyarchaeia archaeon]
MQLKMDFSIQLPKKIIFEEGASQNVPDLAKSFNPESILLVTDPVIRGIGVSDKITEPLQRAGVKVDIFDQVEPEPSVEAAEAVVRFARGSSYDLIIGLGGGSSMDMAKLASISITNPNPITEFVGVGKVPKPGIPKLLIPTTAGTGAEITMNAIISNRVEHLKMGIVSPHIIADVAVIDPLLTVTMPPSVTASTGLDALTHAVESLMSTELNPFCQPLALEAVRLIFRSLPKAYREGKDLEARREMSLAAMFAGISLAISGVCAGHAAAYSFTVTVPHGVGCALALPYVMEMNAPACMPRLVSVAEAAGVKVEGASQEENVFNAVSAVRKLMEAVKSPLSLKDIGIKEADLDHMAEKMLTVKRLLVRNPKTLTEEDAKTLMHRMYVGEQLPLQKYKIQTTT